MTSTGVLTELDQLLMLARDQFGCFSLGDWRHAGLSDTALHTAIAKGWVERVSQRVFRVAGAPPSWHSRVMAATLISSGQVHAGWRTALRLHGLPAWHDPRPHVTIPHELRYRWDRRQIVVHTSRTLASDTPTWAGSILCVSVERSLFEDGMQAVTPAWFDLVCEAVRRGLVTPASLAETLESMGRIPNRKAMRDALGRLDPELVRARSVPEVSLLRLFEDVTGRKALLNHVVRDPRGRRIGELDVADPGLLLGAEGDSRQWHVAPTTMDIDTRKDHRYRRNHWIVPRVPLGWLRSDPDAARAAIQDAHEQALARLHLIPPEFRRAALTPER